MRSGFRCVRRTLPGVFNVIVLLLMVIALFALLLYALFRDKSVSTKLSGVEFRWTPQHTKVPPTPNSARSYSSPVCLRRCSLQNALNRGEGRCIHGQLQRRLL